MLSLLFVAPSLSGPFIPDANFTNGVTLNVGCLATGPPPDQFFMTRNGVIVDESYDVITHNTEASQHFIQHMIPSLGPADYGVYTCIYMIPVFNGGSRSNSISLGGTSLKLYVNYMVYKYAIVCAGPTTSPQNFAVTSITSESFTLSWTLIPGFEPGGLQIGYDITCDPGNDLIRVCCCYIL